MSLFPAGSRLLKVTLGDDTRRLQASSAGSSAADQLQVVRGAIQEGFELSETVMATMLLHYKDDEGDICTLTEATLPDLAALVPEGPLHLMAQLQPQATTTAPAPDAARQQAAGSSADAGGASAGSAAGAAGAAPPGAGGVPFLPFLPPGLDGNAAAAMAMPLLPMLAGLAAGKRDDISRLGAENREALLPLCRLVRERAAAMPEAQASLPFLDAFIDGSDAQRLGDFAAPFVQALVNSPDTAAVQETLSVVLTELLRVGPQLAGGGGGAGAPGGGFPMGFPMPGKGMGKGKKGKGNGKGFPWQELLQGIMMAQQQAQQPQQAAAAAAAANQPTAQDEAMMAEQAADLVDMGVATDTEAALALLAAHGGDIAAVVAAVCDDRPSS